MTAKGAITTAHAAATEAGAQVLHEGGSAGDAAIATAAALCVCDPANCGIGGYGGFMVVHRGRDAPEAQVVDFNTTVPAAFNAASLASAGRTGRFVHGAASVSLPAVLPGLAAAHQTFGRLPLADLLRPAIRLARHGIEVTSDLERSLAWAMRSHGGLSDGFRKTFAPKDEPLTAGQRLVQPKLGESLEYIAARGVGVLREGPLVDDMCTAVAKAGGSLAPGEFAAGAVRIAAAEQSRFGDVAIHGAPAVGSGYGILSRALARLAEQQRPENRQAGYIEALGAALRTAWREHNDRYALLIGEGRHTNHFCASDRDGMLVSCTFTHGPLWFGSGLLAPETGILLNCGVNLFARRRSDGVILPLTNLTPIILSEADGTRHAVGSPGGIRIPAIVLQAVLDLAWYGLPLAQALAQPRVSVDFDGNVEVEPALAGVVPGAREIRTRDYYGPASALSLPASGEPLIARDPRFTSSALVV